MHSKKPLVRTGRKPEVSSALLPKSNGPIQRNSSSKGSSAPYSQHRVLQLQQMYGNKAVLQMLRDNKTLQRMEETEEESEELQMKRDETLQRMEETEEENEELQMKAEGTLQRSEETEEESEELQMKAEGTLQRMEETEEEGEELQMKAEGTLQRSEETEEEGEELQMKAAPSGKMPKSVQSKMEGAFNHNFSDVKIHANSSKAKEVGALAYTQGTDLHFAPGQYNPGSKSGQELLGHELTHVIQQSKGIVKPTIKVNSTNVNDDPGLEREADTMGKKAANYEGASTQPSIQRKSASSATPRDGPIQRMPESKKVKASISPGWLKKQTAGKKEKNRLANKADAYKPILTALDGFHSYTARTNIGRTSTAIRAQLGHIKGLYKTIETAIQAFLEQHATGASAKYFQNLRGQLIDERRELIRAAGEYAVNPPGGEIPWSSLTNSNKHKSIKLSKKQETGKSGKGALNEVKFFQVGKEKGVFKSTKEAFLSGDEFEQQHPNASEEEKESVKTERQVIDSAQIQAQNAHMAERNVAMSRLNDLLGLNVIARAEMGIYKSGGTETKGSFMKKAKGKQASELTNNGDMALSRETKNGNNPYVFDANLQRYMSQLQLLDTLAMQIDRHTGNFFIESDKEGNVVAVTGIDNDLAFGNAEEIDRRVNHYPALSKFVDQELAERILSLKDDDLITVMEDLLAPSEVTALLTRLHKLQTHLQTLKTNNELLAPNQWNEATARGMLEEHAAGEGKGNYYSKIVRINEDERRTKKNTVSTYKTYILMDRLDQLRDLPKKKVKALLAEVEQWKKIAAPMLEQGMETAEIARLTEATPNQVELLRQSLNR